MGGKGPHKALAAFVSGLLQARPIPEDAEPIKQAKRLAEHLGSWVHLDRLKGEHMLENMGDDGPIALARLMRYEAGRIKEDRKKAWISLGRGGIGLLLMWILYTRYFAHVAPIFLGQWLLWLIGCIFTIGEISSRAQNQAARLLVRYYDDIRIVGPLLEALEYRSRQTRHLAIQKLILLLPQMQTEDLEGLDARQRACLRNAIGSKNVDFVLGVLSAIERLEDAAAMPGVEKLAVGDGIAGQHQDVCKAALRCQIVLRARREREQAANMLLRPSAEETHSELLLRAAEETPTASGEQLLRAGDSESKVEIGLATAERTQTTETEVILRVER